MVSFKVSVGFGARVRVEGRVTDRVVFRVPVQWRGRAGISPPRYLGHHDKTLGDG